MNKNFEKVNEEDLSNVVGGKTSVEGFVKKPVNVKNQNALNGLGKAIIGIFNSFFKPKATSNQKATLKFKQSGQGKNA